MRRACFVRTCVAVLAVSIGGGWGCAANVGGAAPKAAEPTRQESAEPATVEEAQAQLERARAELAGPSTAPTTPAADASAVSTPVTGRTTTESSGGGPQPGPSSVGSREARCGHACGAMSSMKRAVDAICRMAGDTDARCADARRTLKDSESKVVGCGCAAP